MLYHRGSMGRYAAFLTMYRARSFSLVDKGSVVTIVSVESNLSSRLAPHAAAAPPAPQHLTA